MSTKSENFKNYADGIKSWVLTTGIIVGGIWAIVKFSALKEADIAKVEYHTKLKALEEVESIKIEMDPKLLYSKDSSKTLLFLSSELTNSGDGPMTFFSPFIVASKLESSSGHYCESSSDSILALRMKPYSTRSIFPETSDKFNFLMDLSDKGYYLVEFFAYECIADLLEDVRDGNNRSRCWYSSIFVSTE